jgi:hypothetical protein
VRAYAILLVVGCGSGTTCKSVTMDPLLGGAQAVRVEVYDPGSASCEGGLLAPGAGPPLVSRKFAAGEPLKLSLAPGTKIVVVSTFSDPDGTMLTATSCSSVDLGAGKAACLSISLVEIDGGVLVDLAEQPDLSGFMPDLTGVQTCGSDAECGGQRCDLVRGICVECLSALDCSTVHGTPACASGACGWSCQPGYAHCMSGNTGCDTDIANTTNCGGCGNQCGTANATANSCTNGQCVYTCQTGFLDCIKVNGNLDGCESDSHALTTCGGCANSCDTTHSMGTACDGTGCTYTGCNAGYSDCNMSGANADGCEFMEVTHSAGVTVNTTPVTYAIPCVPLGTPGNAATYTSAMGIAACMAWTSAVAGGTCALFSCTGNTDCQRASFGGTCVTWCYTKSTAGRVSSGATCSCPNTASPTWN